MRGTRLRRAVGRLRRRMTARAVILMYHRIGPADGDPWHLCVSPERFDEHLSVVARVMRPLSMAQLVKALRERQLPRRAAVVTLDDGYADNLHAAKPLLERHGVPATVFVTSGYVGSPREFWWDELEDLVLRPDLLPPTLRLELAGRVHQLELGEAARYDEAQRRGDRARRTWEAPASTRLGFYRAVWELLRPVSPVERQRALDALRAWVGHDGHARGTHRPLDRGEVATLARGGLVEIGAHSVSHPHLSSLEPAAQREEIWRCKADLEGMVSQPVTSFAYPHGDFAPVTASLVREAGFASACSTVAESIGVRSDAYALPRFAVGDWSGDELAKKLAAWLVE
jgi:peptidoglycan/xylan/chitin deacetylase (PgdA/CDA1 family)